MFVTKFESHINIFNFSYCSIVLFLRNNGTIKITFPMVLGVSRQLVRKVVCPKINLNSNPNLTLTVNLTLNLTLTLTLTN